MLSKAWPVAHPAYRAPRSYFTADDRREAVTALRAGVHGLARRMRLAVRITRPAAPAAAGASR